MAVASTLSLPNAAAAFLPLAGDGLAAPLAAYEFSQALSGDGSAGAASHTVTLDSRYCSTVTYMAMEVNGTNSDVQFRATIDNVGPSIGPRIALTGTLVGVASTVSSIGACGYWAPPSLILPPAARITWSCPNVDADVFTFSFECLLWDINVRNKSPYPYLVAAVSSGGAVSPGI